MACVDLETGKIYGCKKGSFSWWHEKAHLIFDKLGWAVHLKAFTSVLIMLYFFFIPLNFFLNSLILKIFCFLLGAIIALAFFFEELWCDYYAFKKLKERK